VKQSFVFNSKLRSLHPAAANLRKVGLVLKMVREKNSARGKYFLPLAKQINTFCQAAFREYGDE